MYKNHSKYTSTLIWSILGLVFGILPFMLISCIVLKEYEVSVIVFSLFSIMVGIVFTVLGIRGINLILAVSSCNWDFEKDADGIVVCGILRK